MSELSTDSRPALDTQDENAVFQEWKSSSGMTKEEVQAHLVRLLMKHARSVCWQKLPDHQSEHSWISNESVYRALSKASNFQGKSKFSTWFHRIVLNECNRVLKSKQQKAEVPIDDALDAADSGGADIERAILAEQVQKMGRPQDRRVVGLILNGASYRDVAAELHISKGYARKVWQRVVERLRDGVVE
jgi:RNA polymerase sigma factor (sigma-70 family)